MQKLKSTICVVVSIIFSVAFAGFWYFNVHSAIVSSVYERIVNYQEDVYEKYEQEIERMIASKEYISQYPMQATSSFKDGRITLTIEIGDYENTKTWSDYVTATIKNYGTDEQEVTMKRSRENVEAIYKDAEEYLNEMRIMWMVYLTIFIIFALYLIVNSIKRKYKKVLSIILFIIAIIVAFKIWFYVC